MSRNLAKEAADAIEVKSVWGHQLITTNRSRDGGEDYWYLQSRVTPRDCAPRRETEWIPCQWPVMSAWRRGSCSRMVPQEASGLSLCWQHLDDCFSDTLGRLIDGQLSRRQVDELVGAILNSESFQPNGSPNWHPDIATFVEEQIRSYLFRLVHDEAGEWADTWLTREPRRDIEELLNELIEKRIKQTWGSE